MRTLWWFQINHFALTWNNLLSTCDPVDVTSQPAFTYSKLTKETENKVRNMFKVNNKDPRTMSGVFTFNFEQVSHLALVFLSLTLSM